MCGCSYHLLNRSNRPFHLFDVLVGGAGLEVDGAREVAESVFLVGVG